MQVKIIKMKKAVKDREFSSIVALINEHDEILLLKRLNNPNVAYPNLWGMPGGGVDIGEDPYQAALREVYEETNVKIKRENLKFINKLKKNNKDVYVFACCDFSGEVSTEKVLKEHQDWKWIPEQKLKDFETPPETSLIFKRAIVILKRNHARR